MQNVNVESSGAHKVATVGPTQDQWRPLKGMKEMYKFWILYGG